MTAVTAVTVIDIAVTVVTADTDCLKIIKGIIVEGDYYEIYRKRA